MISWGSPPQGLGTHWMPTPVRQSGKHLGCSGGTWAGRSPLGPAVERGWAPGGVDRGGMGHLLRGTLASKRDFAWTQ